MPIAVDLVLATRPNASTGIERYAINLFKALRDIAPDTVAFVDRRSSVLEGEGIRRVKGGFGGWVSLPFSAQYRAQPISALICPAFPPSPIAIFGKTPIYRIIHDDFPWTRSHAMNARGRLLFKHLEGWMAPRYAALFAPTDLMARNLASILKLSVATIGNAPGIDLSTAPSPDRRAPQLIAVGTIEPRKNYEAVLALAADLPRPWSVAVVGRNGWGKIATDWERHVQERGGALAWHGHASDAALLGLYQTSTCFISMSLAEGFNMPLVEAGSLGLPVICSDIEIHRQVAPPWAHLVPLSIPPSDLSKLVIQVSQNPPAQAEVSAYRQQFGWQSIAARLTHEIAL
ncbi:hypothetical protein BH10PSE15_BH10PSE15_02180 [soil metagenome]